MTASILTLREALGDLLQYYPLVLRNVFQTPSTDAAAPPPPPSSPSPKSTHDGNHMADAVEGFLSELTRALSLGLGEGDGFELWSVLELLECVPDRMAAVAEAEASSPATQSTKSPATAAGGTLSPSHSLSQKPRLLSASRTQPHSASDRRGGDGGGAATVPSASSPSLSAQHQESPASWQHHLQRFRFASQLVYVVRSTFPAAPRPLQARILLRLALNQGCLLAALELLRGWCRAELEGFYSHPTDSTAALLTQPDEDSDEWNAFVAAIAPVGGPPVVEIAAGAPKTAAQAFHLQLVVAGLDDDSAASRAYYTQLNSYTQGRRGTRPSALACYEASQRQKRGGDGSAAQVDAVAVVAAGVSRPRRRAAAPPAQQHSLTVETLPVVKESWSAAAAGTTAFVKGETDDTSATTRSSSQSAQQQQTRRRRRRRRSRLVNADEEAAENNAAAAAKAGGREVQAEAGCPSPPASSQSSHNAAASTHHRHHSSLSSRRASTSSSDEKHADSEKMLNSGAKLGDTAVFSSSDPTPNAPAPTLSVWTLFNATDYETPHDEVGSEKTRVLPPELRELRRRVLRCWAVAVAHAESQERKRLSACDVDANDVAAN